MRPALAVRLSAVLIAGAATRAAQPLPEQTTAPVIFADDRYDVVGWAGDPAGTREFFVARDFKPVQAEELAVWMTERIAQGAYGSVALLPTGIVPGALLEPGGWEAVCKGWSDKKHFAQSTLRRYLAAGGRLEWMGDVTFYYLQGPTGPIRCAGGLLPQLVDVTTDPRIFYGPPGHEQALTDEGRQWGLTQPWFGMPCNAVDVTQTLVAAPTEGLRCGDYTLQVTFAAAGGEPRAEQALEVTLVPSPENPFFLGLWGQVPANPFRRAQYLDEIRGYRLNPVCSPGYDDDLLRRGLRFVQRIEAYEGFTHAVDPAREPELARRGADGKAPPNPWRPALSLASIAHPQVLAGWSEGQREQIRQLPSHPAWFPAILTCDDFSAFYGEDFGPTSISPGMSRATTAMPSSCTSPAGSPG